MRHRSIIRVVSLILIFTFRDTSIIWSQFTGGISVGRKL